MNKCLGAQLYTIRDFAKTPEEVKTAFELVADIGYKSVQVSGICQMDAEQLNSIAKDTGLEIALTHNSFERLANELDAVMAEHEKFGCKIIGLGGMPTNFRGSAEGVLAFAKQFNAIAKELALNGFTFGYHNHAFEFNKYNGKYGFDILLENTDPNAFQFILDVYWLQYGGQNPIEVIKKLNGRIATIHLKDYAMVGDEIKMAEIFNGNLDWQGIVSAAKGSNSPWFMVEQDICPGDPFESLAISYRNIKKSGLFK